jgi:calcineurin-like phosphoesterase family protein
MIFTHIPIHPDSIGKSKANIHGHVHTHEQGGFGPKYFNVACEALNYVPISLEDIKKAVQKQTGEVW